MKWVIGISIFAIAMGLAGTAMMPARAAVGIDEVSLKFLPPETKGILFVDVVGLRSASIVQEALKGKDLTFPASVDEMIRRTNFDPERDLEKLTIAKLDAGQGFIIAQGRIDKFKVEQFMKDQGNTSEAYLGQTLYRDGDSTLAFFDNVAIAGQEKAVKRAVEQMQLPAAQPLRNDLLTAINSIEPGNQVWGAGDISTRDLDTLGVRGPAPVVDMMKSLQKGTYQMRVDTGIHARATGEFADAESARNIGDLAHGALALAKMQAGRQNPEFVELLDGVDVSYNGATITVRIEASEEALKKLKNYRPTIEKALQ